MNKTYSELRQQAYFECGRKLVKVAQAVLDDTFAESGVQSGELVTRQTARWAIDLARRSAKAAHEEFEKGHEQCVASALAETVNGRAWDAYSQAITRFEIRVRAAHPGIGNVIAWANEGAPAFEVVTTPRPAGF